MVVRAMSDLTDEMPVDLSDLPISEVDDDIIHPNSGGNSDTPPSDGLPDNAENARPESAADRVRARFRHSRRAGSEPRTPRAAREKARASIPKPRSGSLVKPLTDLYTSIGVMLAPFDPACSVSVIENAESCAIALENLARENEAVRRAILALTQTSAWGGVLIAHMPILLMVITHHGPKQVADAVAPMAMLTNASAMQRVAEQANKPEDNGGASDV
jgi:hypothetical protein